MMDFSTYEQGSAYDETFASDGLPRPTGGTVGSAASIADARRIATASKGGRRRSWNMGITFNVYGHEAGLEKVWPFDILPRIVGGEEWPQIERGLQQRIRALNLFMHDIYNGRKICQDGIVPEELVATAKTLRPACNGTTPPQGVWCHVTGTDLVRNQRRAALCVGRQSPLPLGRFLRAGKSRGDETDVSASVQWHAGHAGRRLSRKAFGHAAAHGAQGRRFADGRAADAREFTTRPISSIRSWPSRWGSNWSKAAIW